MSLPILVILYNRPDKIRQIVESLNNIAATQVFFFADGPKSQDDDFIRCCNARACINLLSTKHRAIKNFQTINLGCANSCLRAVDWFFSLVDCGLILEDDIILTKSGYGQAEILSRNLIYDEQIFALSLSPFIRTTNETPFLSSYLNVWGWCTCRSKWLAFRAYWTKATIRTLGTDIIYLENLRITHKIYWFFVLASIKSGWNCWDHPIQLYAWIENKKFLVLPFPTTLNIGFDQDGTTLKRPPDFVKELDLVDECILLNNNAIFHDDLRYDESCSKVVFNISPASILRKALKFFLILLQRP